MEEKPGQVFRNRILRITAAHFAHTGATVQHGGNQACYAHRHDRINIPLFEAFKDAESY